MHQSAIIKLAIKVAITGIVAVVVAFAVYNIKHRSDTGRASHKLFHKNPLIGHEEEVLKLLYKRDTPNLDDDHTWAEAKKYYFNINTFLGCYVNKKDIKAMNMVSKKARDAFWKDCAHMARIEMAFAKSQGKFTNSTLEDWLDQRLLKVLYQTQEAKLNYEDKG